MDERSDTIGMDAEEPLLTASALALRFAVSRTWVYQAVVRFRTRASL